MGSHSGEGNAPPPLLCSSTLNITELHPISFGSKARAELITQCSHSKAKFGFSSRAIPREAMCPPTLLWGAWRGRQKARELLTPAWVFVFWCRNFPMFKIPREKGDMGKAVVGGWLAGCASFILKVGNIASPTSVSPSDLSSRHHTTFSYSEPTAFITYGPLWLHLLAQIM